MSSSNERGPTAAGTINNSRVDFDMSMHMDLDVQYIKGVGPKLGETLARKGVRQLHDLLEWYPRAYEDRRKARDIASLKADELVSLKAQVLKVSSYQMGQSSKSRRKIYDVTLHDSSGRVHCKYFRAPYKGYFERFQPGQIVRVSGKVTLYRGQIEFHHPDIQDLETSIDADTEPESHALIPIYPETEGLSTRQLTKLIGFVLQQLRLEGWGEEPSLQKNVAPERPWRMDARTSPRTAGAFSANIPRIADLEKLPRWLRAEFALPHRLEALENVHHPKIELAEDLLAFRSIHQRRLIFEEFFWLEFALLAKRAGIKRDAAPRLDARGELMRTLIASLPFPLTQAQHRVLKEIQTDLAKEHPMHRLLQGDVGSGKTLVALSAATLAIEGQHQVAIMVPTEILAEQHYQNAKKFLEPLGITVGLLTGSQATADRRQTLELLQAGVIQVCVGTHALIQDGVEFQRLGLVVIDEQHRFGVHQRSKLKQKGYAPHFLVMTATPIPRTLAMTVYGDLDVSVIDEMPPGRTPIQTRVVYESYRPKVLAFLQEQVQRGRQAYFVYPLVEESEKIDLRDAMSQFELLKAQMPQFRIGLLHGRMKPAEKEQVMNEFRSGLLQILVATTVIEVGVDVPNATLMIIEHAERFGLSQLHQLRGRVGRGTQKSFCILMLGQAVSQEARERTVLMEKTQDGFALSEADLEWRGPGEFLGAKQSGLSGFRMANLLRDVSILQEARRAAELVIQRDPKLSHVENRLLREELLKVHGITAMAFVG